MEDVLHQILLELKDLKAGQNRLEQRMDRMENRMDRMERRMDRMEQRMDSMENRMDRMEQDIADLKETQSVMQQDIADMKQDISEMKENIADLTDRMDDKHAMVTALVEGQTRLEEKIDEVRAEQQRQNITINWLVRVTMQNCADIAYLRQRVA